MPSMDATIGDLAGRVIGAETWTPGVEMIRGELPTEKTLTLGQYARLWESGQDPSGAASLGGPSDPFRQSLWVYRCVTVIATNAARVPMRLSRGEAAGTRGLWGAKRVRLGSRRGRKIRRGEKANLKAREGEIVEAGELYELLARPNPHQTWFQLMLQTVGLLFAEGRVHWLFDEMRGRVPLTIYAVSGKQTEPVYEKGRRVPVLTGWKFTEPGGKSYGVSLDELITWQLFNPKDPHAGLAPKVPANLAIVSDYNASLYNAAMFGNSAEPGGVLTTDAEFTPEADEQIRTSWNQRHRGAANARKMSVLWGGMKWDATATTMRDLQFIEGKQLTRMEICAVFGVPPTVAGFFGTTGDSAAYTDNELERFWQDTVMPLLAGLAEGVEVHLAPRFAGGLDVWADVEDVPIVQKMRLANMKTVDSLWAKGVPMEDLNARFDLGLPARPQHRLGWLPVNVVPAAEAASGNVTEPVDEGPSAPGNDELDQPTGETAQNAENAEGKSGWIFHKVTMHPEKWELPFAKAAAERVWQAWARSWTPLARAMRGFLRGHYSRQERAVLAALKKYLTVHNAYGRKLGKDDAGEIVGRVLFDVFEDPPAKAGFRKRVRAFITEANELGLRQALHEGGFAAEALDEAVGALAANPAITAEIQGEAVRLSTLIDNASRRILRRSLTSGLTAGEDIRRLADRVQSVMGNRRAAAMTVARNTVGQTLSASRHRGHLAAGMTHKWWLHSRGPGERRPAHVAAEGVYAKNPIPLGERFIVNGKGLLYPRDFSSGHVDECVNCQCVQIAKRQRQGGKSAPTFSEALRDYAVRGFYGYADMTAARAAANEDKDHEPDDRD